MSTERPGEEGRIRFDLANRTVSVPGSMIERGIEGTLHKVADALGGFFGGGHDMLTKKAARDWKAAHKRYADAVKLLDEAIVDANTVLAGAREDLQGAIDEHNRTAEEAEGIVNDHIEDVNDALARLAWIAEETQVALVEAYQDEEDEDAAKEIRQRIVAWEEIDLTDVEPVAIERANDLDLDADAIEEIEIPAELLDADAIEGIEIPAELPKDPTR